MSLFGKKTEASVGVDIGAGGIKIVELHKTKNRPQLWTYGIVDEDLDIHVGHEKNAQELLAENKKDVAKAMKEKKKAKKEIPVQVVDPRVDKYAKLLKTAAEAARITTKRATASLPVSYVFHAMITLPVVPEKELTHHVNAKVTKMLPRPIEQMQVVHQVLPVPKGTKPKDIRILVTAAPKEVVQFYSAIFQKAGFQLEELETEAFALERCLVGRDKSTSMIVDIGAERTNFFIVDQGLPVTHRSIQIGGDAFSVILEQQLGIDAAHTGIIKADLSRLPAEKVPADMFMSLLDPIIKEIQYGFDLYLHQTGNQQKRPEKIILTGGASVFPPIVSALQRAFSMKVFVGDPWARVVYQQRLKGLLDAYGPRMAVSIGLALRNIVGKDEMGKAKR